MMRVIVRGFAWLCTHFLRSVKVIGAEKVPENGGVILCGNHVSIWDVFALFAHVRRPMSFMAKAELFRIPVVSQVIRKCGAFPVQRGTSDLGAIRTALGVLKSQKALTIFQTGHRNSEEAKNGAVYLALKSKTPILPFSIDGNFRLFSRTIVRFGTPVSLEEYYDAKLSAETLNKVSAEIWETIRRMVKECEESNLHC